MLEINNMLIIYCVQNNLKVFSIEINKINKILIKKLSLKKIKAKFYFDFHDLL